MFLIPDMACQAFAQQNYSIHILTPDHPGWSAAINEASKFHAETAGSEKLVERDCPPDTLVSVCYKRGMVAQSKGYFHGDDLYEIGGVLVDPAHAGKGIYKIMRDAHRALENGRVCALFCRLSNEDKNNLLQKAEWSEWEILPASHAYYQRIEQTKPVTQHHLPKVAFARVATGTGLAFHNEDGTARKRPAAIAPALLY